MRAMVVDSSKAMRTVLKRVLHECGYDDVIEAPTAQSALDSLAACGAADLPQLALLDDNLADADSADLAQAVRERDGAGHVAVVMLTTATAPAGTGQATAAAGADDCVTKPFTRAALVEALAHVGARR